MNSMMQLVLNETSSRKKRDMIEEGGHGGMGMLIYSDFIIKSYHFLG
jgi:hypothetical protein